MVFLVQYFGPFQAALVASIVQIVHPPLYQPAHHNLDSVWRMTVWSEIMFPESKNIHSQKDSELLLDIYLHCIKM